ncbi:Bin3-domain-containing protein [Trametes versicolor FP-101664 SS1]|uniref:Bin3-domain-containing protein n=1 Tax=Trametes versicolor (strain FP-101664) TaxID=717944 RepID=UPI00046236D8|nr:Bin3-domain-containing protein [Trametes versicolor FP-101664 SS1]EIW61473.1 Bin3-domain-containing protein [Trametes versicolor FP-101664 SS1]
MANKLATPVYGNYHGYYNKRPSTQDPRLELLPAALFRGQRVLDVGCNEGWVTCEIAQTLDAKRVVGVDIDDTLVRAAWKHRRSVWSQQGPGADSLETPSSDDTTHGGRKRRRLSQSEDEAGFTIASQGAPDYFPASCEHMFGALPIPAAAPHEKAADVFPHNVAFRAADWVNSGIPDDAEGYDVVIAFSISKWIHLNCGDEGLLEFFRRVHQVLSPGGVFVLEPQEWDTYGKARRMDPKLKENAKSLKLRPEDFERLLQDIGFGPAEHLGSAGEGGKLCI